MALQTVQITVGTTPTELSGTDTDGRSGSSLAVQAPAAATLYVGPAGVTAATGWPVAAGTQFAVDLQPGERLYGVLASGSGSVAVIRTGV